MTGPTWKSFVEMIRALKEAQADGDESAIEDTAALFCDDLGFIERLVEQLTPEQIAAMERKGDEPLWETAA